MILPHFQFSLYGVVVFLGDFFKGCIFHWQNLHIMLRNFFVMKSVGVILFFLLIWTCPFVGPLNSLTIGFLCIIFSLWLVFFWITTISHSFISVSFWYCTYLYNISESFWDRKSYLYLKWKLLSCVWLFATSWTI